MDKDDGQVKTKEVGHTMEAKLDPDEPIKGGDARSSFQKDMYDSLKYYWDPGAKHWVRGHLLNANLGGPNVAPNLFPITGHANGDHLNYVENHIKSWVIAGNKVTYKVTAAQQGGNVTVGDVGGVPNAAGSFTCYAEMTGDDDEKKVINRVINSIPVKHDSPGDDPTGGRGHTSNWSKVDVDDDSPQKDNALDKSTWGGLSVDQARFTIDLFLHLRDGALNALTFWKLVFKYNLSLEEVAQVDNGFRNIPQEDQLGTDHHAADTELAKVAARVTNVKLKDWLGAKLTTNQAAAWLNDKKQDDDSYKVSSS